VRISIKRLENCLKELGPVSSGTFPILTDYFFLPFRSNTLDEFAVLSPGVID